MKSLTPRILRRFGYRDTLVVNGMSLLPGLYDLRLFPARLALSRHVPAC